MCRCFIPYISDTTYSIMFWVQSIFCHVGFFTLSFFHVSVIYYNFVKLFLSFLRINWYWLNQYFLSFVPGKKKLDSYNESMRYIVKWLIYYIIIDQCKSFTFRWMNIVCTQYKIQMMTEEIQKLTCMIWEIMSEMESWEQCEWLIRLCF